MNRKKWDNKRIFGGVFLSVVAIALIAIIVSNSSEDGTTGNFAFGPFSNDFSLTGPSSSSPLNGPYYCWGSSATDYQITTETSTPYHWYSQHSWEPYCFTPAHTCGGWCNLKGYELGKVSNLQCICSNSSSLWLWLVIIIGGVLIIGGVVTILILWKKGIIFK